MKVLVVDDDVMVANMLRINFESEGHKVEMAHDGIAAVKSAQSFHPDMFVMDIHMPEANGIDVLSYLRNAPATCMIPVIFVTGVETEKLDALASEHTRVAYMQKPVNLDSLNTLVLLFQKKYAQPLLPDVASPQKIEIERFESVFDS